MRLVLLGTNGLHHTDERETACYMLPELGIVLDAGSGLRRMSQYLQTESLDIYLTHAHSDHYIGLDSLDGVVWAYKFTASGLPATDESMEALFAVTQEFIGRVAVHAAPPTLAELQKRSVFDWQAVRWLPLEAEEKIAGAGVLTHFPLEHTTPCFGFRLDWPGHSLAYVTDTIARPSAAYIERIAGVDLLLHDSYLPNSLAGTAERTGHSHTRAVAQVAAVAKVGRLVLIHHNTLGLPLGGAELDSACEIFPATDIGLDRMEIEF